MQPLGPATSECQRKDRPVKLLIGFGKALRVKAVRVLPILGRVVRAVNEYNDRRPLGYLPRSPTLSSERAMRSTMEKPAGKERSASTDDLGGKLEFPNV